MRYAGIRGHVVKIENRKPTIEVGFFMGLVSLNISL